MTVHVFTRPFLRMPSRAFAHARRIVIAMLAASVGVVWASHDPSALQRRDGLLDVFRQNHADARGRLEAALQDEAAAVRRTAAHLLARIGRPAEAALAEALAHADFQVRRIALAALADMGVIDGHLSVALADEHPSIRRDVDLLLQRHPWILATRLWSLGKEADLDGTLVDRLSAVLRAADADVRDAFGEILSAAMPLPPKASELLPAAIGDRAVEALAAFGLDWREHQELLRLAVTTEITEFREIALRARWERSPGRLAEIRDQQTPETVLDVPEEGWRFRTDRERIGHRDGWFEPGWNDADWREAQIAMPWHRFLGESYVGAGWYRRLVDMPSLASGQGVLLRFEGVDEAAWVWVNGRFAGRHDVGPVGWTVPFHVDITDLIRPGEANQVTVRVRNTAMAGGVFRPVRIEVYNAEGKGGDGP